MSAPGRQKILLIEDVEDNRGIVRQLAARLKVTLVEAADGVEGLRLAGEEMPDLVLLDLSLPLLDGWEVARRLKADPATAHLRLVALTAHALEEDKTRALAVGMEAYFTKPISLVPFGEMLKRVLAGEPA